MKILAKSVSFGAKIRCFALVCSFLLISAHFQVFWVISQPKIFANFRLCLLKPTEESPCAKLFVNYYSLFIQPNTWFHAHNVKLILFQRIERTRANLILRRNQAIAQLKELDPTYVPPAGFHFKNANLEDKVFIPAEVSLTLK